MATSSPRSASAARASRRSGTSRRRTQPIAWAIWTAAEPTPLPTAWIKTRSPGLRLALGLEGIVGRDERLGDGRGLLEVEVRGDRHGHPLGADDVLGLPPPPTMPKTRSPTLNVPGHIAARAASTSPANSRPGMSAGTPGGAG